MRVLVDSAGRAEGSVLSKVKLCKNMGFCTYTHLYKSCVLCLRLWVWCLVCLSVIMCNVHYIAVLLSFLGVHKFTPVWAVSGNAER